jgi:hypothetical protein
MQFYLFDWFGAFWVCTTYSMQWISADTSSPEKPGDSNKSMCILKPLQLSYIDQLRLEMGLPPGPF